GGVLSRGERGFAFAHGLFRDTIYSGLSTAGRANLHRRLAAALEHRRRRGSATLAHHYVEAAAGDETLPEKAIDYSMRAGAEASLELAYEESARHFDMALTHADSLEPGRRAELLLEVARAHTSQATREKPWTPRRMLLGSARSSLTQSCSRAPR